MLPNELSERGRIKNGRLPEEANSLSEANS